MPFFHRLLARVPGLAGVHRLAALLALGLLLMNPAVAQRACIRVVDPTTGDTVSALCAGRDYVLHHCDEPLGPNTTVVYDTTGVVPVRYQFPAASTSIRFNFPGPRRIYQLANTLGSNVETSRVYQVFSTAAPRVRVDTCLRSVITTILDTTYSGYLVKVIFDSDPSASSEPISAGIPKSSTTRPGTAALRVQVIVTGSDLIPVPPNGYRRACETTPFDTAFTLHALPPPPRIQRLDVRAPTAAHEVRLHLSRLLPGTSYAVERAPPLPAAGPWTTLTPPFLAAQATDSVTLNGAPTATRHRYRLRQLRGTGCDATLPDAALLSNEAGALPLTSLTVGVGGASTVRWPDYPAAGTVRGWRVRRDGREIARLPATARTYTEPGEPGCPQVRCYEVLAVVLPLPLSPTDTLLAFSGDSCATTAPVPPAPPALKASFDLSNNLVLRATPPLPALAASFEFSEVQPGPPPVVTVLDTTPSPVLTLIAPDTGLVRRVCYTVILADTCGQRSFPSDPACPTVLRAHRSPDNLTAHLRWEFRGSPVPVTYTVELLNDQTNVVLRSVLIAPNIFAYSDLNLNRQVPRYRIRVDAPGDTSRLVYSNFVDLPDQQLVRLPTAFTPNGDNLNDTFGPVGRYELREQELTIYDRWGRELFRTTTPGQAWDGRPPGGGDIVPPGVFAYRFRGRDAAGREFSQKGTVTVLR